MPIVVDNPHVLRPVGTVGSFRAMAPRRRKSAHPALPGELRAETPRPTSWALSFKDSSSPNFAVVAEHALLIPTVGPHGGNGLLANVACSTKSHVSVRAWPAWAYASRSRSWILKRFEPIFLAAQTWPASRNCGLSAPFGKPAECARQPSPAELLTPCHNKSNQGGRHIPDELTAKDLCLFVQKSPQGEDGYAF